MPAEPPLISVVIPVHGVGEYLPDCLGSVLGGPEPGLPGGHRIEVIAVDDASPDGAGRLLDEMAAGDPRLAVVHLERSAGPGNARNLGLARAAGRYVWFVDGDDSITSGALCQIAERLLAQRPDVLLIDYQDVYPGGRTAPSPGAPLLRAAPRGLFTLAQAPDLIRLAMTAWSKVFRRDFLLALGEPFRPGIHEDIPVTCAALLAGRLSALPVVCYRYRRARPGSFMATTASGHLAVFDAYAGVLERLRRLAEAGDPVATPAVRQAVFERAISHYANVLQARGASGRGLVPRPERRRFFRRMHEEFERHAPPGYRPPPGALGAKFRLIRRDAYLAYEALEPVNRARLALRRGLRGAGAAGDSRP